MIYSVLSVGPIPELLTTRDAVLRQAGFLVRTSFDLSEALELFRDGDFDAAILCHSIPARDKERFVQLLKEYKPLTPIVAMTNGHGASSADMEIHSLDGPEELLRQVAQVIAASRSTRRGTR